GLGLEEQVLLEEVIDVAPLLEAAELDRGLARVGQDLELAVPGLDAPVEVAEQRVADEADVLVAAALEGGDRAARDLQRAAEAGAGRRRDRLALGLAGDQRVGLGLGRQRRDDEVVGRDLVAVDLGVVVEPDVRPLRVPGLRAGHAHVDRHDERVGDEQGEVDDGGQDQRVAERGLALEEARPLQIAHSVSRSKRKALDMSKKRSRWSRRLTPSWISAVSWSRPAAQRAVTMTSWPS